MRSHRPCREHGQRSRQHRSGQHLREVFHDQRRVEILGGHAGARHDVGGDVALVDHGEGRCDTSDRSEGSFHFPQFDTNTADLDLVVCSSHKFELPVDRPAHQVPGAVHAVRRPGERCSDKPLGGESCSAHVAARQSCAHQIQLTCGTDRAWLQSRIEHDDRNAVDRPAQGKASAGFQRFTHYCGYRRLSGTVRIDDSDVL